MRVLAWHVWLVDITCTAKSTRSCLMYSPCRMQARRLEQRFRYIPATLGLYDLKMSVLYPIQNKNFSRHKTLRTLPSTFGFHDLEKLVTRWQASEPLMLQASVVWKRVKVTEFWKSPHQPDHFQSRWSWHTNQRMVLRRIWGVVDIDVPPSGSANTRVIGSCIID